MRVRVSVVGLGKLGAPLAAVMARAGHEVMGYDVDRRAVAALRAGRSPVEEPGLAELIAAHADRIHATSDCREAVISSDVTFVIVPTPSGADDTFDSRLVIAAVEEIGQAVRDKDAWHLVVITSTVMPNETGGPIAAALEHASGRRVGEGMGLCYSPEFIALGTVVRDMLHPDLILVGESDERAGSVLTELLCSVTENDPPVRRLSLVDAELAKLANNCFVAMKVSFANQLAEICERLLGADAAQVAEAIGLDRRIGGRLLVPATAFGGPCWPRDNKAFARLARVVGAEATLSEATDVVNERQADRLAELVTRHLPAGGRIGILGLTYKAGTHVADRSAAIELVLALADRGHRPLVYDPALAVERAGLGDKAEAAASAGGCITAADVIVITTPWPEFGDGLLTHLTPGSVKTFVDCWGLLDPERWEPAAHVIRPGVGPRF
jgi:UDPglucose 6-dehydrogenase